MIPELDGIDFSLLMAFARESFSVRENPEVQNAYISQLRTAEAKNTIQFLIQPDLNNTIAKLVCLGAGITGANQ